MLDALVGRQPIFDRRLRVHAYELLFRSDGENRALFSDGNQATSTVILNTFVEIGLEKVVGKHPAFINFTRAFVLGQYPIPAQADRIVLEVLEDVQPDEDVVRALKGYAKAGYRIALDDFVYSDAHRPMVEIAHIIKLDLLALGRQRLEEQVKILKPFKLKLLAEKVDSNEDLKFCKDLGMDYFQGYFLSKPQIVKGQRPPQNRLALLRLLSKIYDPNIEIREVEHLVTQDVALSYRLVRCVNSALYARPYKVDSIRQAITMLGLEQLAGWVSVMTMSGIADKPHELIVTAMVRAKMCESLARHLKLPNADSLFTVGLFSVLDALLDMPMEEVLKTMPLAEDLVGALLKGEGIKGEILACVRAHERAEWEEVAKLGLSTQIISGAWLAAVRWAEEATSTVLQNGAGGTR